VIYDNEGVYENWVDIAADSSPLVLAVKEPIGTSGSPPHAGSNQRTDDSSAVKISPKSPSFDRKVYSEWPISQGANGSCGEN
jgi:hypothetical protein